MGIKHRLKQLENLEKADKRKKVRQRKNLKNKLKNLPKNEKVTEQIQDLADTSKENKFDAPKVSSNPQNSDLEEELYSAFVEPTTASDEDLDLNLDILKKSSSGRSTVAYNLPYLQNLMKKDDISYLEEFKKQYFRFESLYELFLLDPTQQNYNNNFVELVQFLANVSSCQAYKDTLVPDDIHSNLPPSEGSFSGRIIHLLNSFGVDLNPDIRLALARVLITMRNKGSLAPLELHKLCFKLFNIQDKNLREILYAFIINDIKSINNKSKDNKLNKSLQNYLYSIIHENDNKICCKLAVDACVELYKRHIWRDAKTVNVLSSACFSKFAAIVKASLTFFIEAGANKKAEDYDSDHESGDNWDDSDEEENELNGPTAEQYVMKQIGASSKNTKKIAKKKRKAADLLEKLRKKRKSMQKAGANDGNFAALHLIYDPQDFAERLFKQMQKAKEKFETKLLYVDLIAKLIGVHQLFLLNFYPYCQKWLNPQQRNVTKVLVALTTASHDLVPPEIIQQTIRTIADNFVSENNSSEVMAVGINSIREISKRTPLAMTEEILQDLALYKKHKIKAVSAAAKSLIASFREIDRSMLSRKDQGRPEEELDIGFTSNKKTEYGASKTLDFIPGAEDLEDDTPEEGENVAANKILGQEDFEKIKRNQILAKVLKEKQARKLLEKEKRGQLDDEENSEAESSEIDEAELENEIATTTKKADIELFRKQYTRSEIVSDSSVLFVEGAKRQHDKQTRMESIEAGREDKSKYKFKTKLNEKTSSGTNKQKNKKKSFSMVKHKMNSKLVCRNYKEKADRLRENLKKQQNKKHRSRF